MENSQNFNGGLLEFIAGFDAMVGDEIQQCVECNDEFVDDEEEFFNLVSKMHHDLPSANIEADRNGIFDHSQTEDLITLAPMEAQMHPVTFAPELQTHEHLVQEGSPVPSPSGLETTTTAYDRLDNIFRVPLSSPNTADDIISVVVAPTEVCGEPKRKRGRRPKSEMGKYVPPPRPRKERKRKIYEINVPFEDVVEEKKRLNAVNAKKHRDHQKIMQHTLKIQLDEVTTERDHYKEEVESLKTREMELLKQIEDYKKHAFNLMSVFQKEPLAV